MGTGNFGYGGGQRSYSFGCFHADRIPNSTETVICPTLFCEWIQFQNDPDSTGNIVVGSLRLGVVGNGIELEPGQSSSWIPASNLNLFYHKETDGTTYLNYMVIGCKVSSTLVPAVSGYLLQENSDYLLQENGSKIIL